MDDKRKSSFKWLWWLVAFALILSLGVALFLRSSAKSQQNSSAKQDTALLTVMLVAPVQEEWPTIVEAGGALSAWHEAAISAEMGGLRIEQILVDVGSEVVQGQLLAQLSQETVRAELRRQEANVAQAKAGLLEASANAKRARSIENSGAISAQQVHQYLVAEETAQAALAVAQAQWEGERIRLKQTRIVAPDDGVIASRSAMLGAVVAPGSELFRMVRQGRIEWRAEVHGSQLPLIKEGQEALLTLPGGETLKGRVRMLAPTLDDTTRYALVYVDLLEDEQSPVARVGMYVSGQIVIGNKKALVLPLSAIALRDDSAYVFEIGDDERVIQRRVILGQYKGNSVAVTEGIDENTLVVLSGTSFLNAGDKVRVASTGQEKQHTQVKP